MQTLLCARNGSPTEVSFLPNGAAADASYGVHDRESNSYLERNSIRQAPARRLQSTAYELLGRRGTGLNFRKSADERESTEGSPECQSGSVDGNILFPAIVLISASSSGFRRRETRVEATRRSPKRLRQCPIDLMATTGPYARCCSKRF